MNDTTGCAAAQPGFSSDQTFELGVQWIGVLWILVLQEFGS